MSPYVESLENNAWRETAAIYPALSDGPPWFVTCSIMWWLRRGRGRGMRPGADRRARRGLHASDALAAAEATGLPFAAFVHTLYARVAAADRSPMAAFADVGRINSLRDSLGVALLSRVTEALDRAARVLVATVPTLDRPRGAVAGERPLRGGDDRAPGPDQAWAPPNRLICPWWW